MYAQRRIQPYAFGFPQLPVSQRQAMGMPQGQTVTSPIPQQPQQSPMGGFGSIASGLAMRQALSGPASTPLYGATEAGVAADAADAASPYAAESLLANGADPAVMSQLAAGTPAADLGFGAGVAPAMEAASTAAPVEGALASGAAEGALAEGGTAAAAGEGGLLAGAGALGPIALAGLGIYGLGSLLDWW